MTPGACSSPSLQQQQPPPPYGMPPGKPPTPSSGAKLQKAGLPEKYDKLNKSGSASPHPGNMQLPLDPQQGGGGDGMMFGKPGIGMGMGPGSMTSASGLQTTPSPQLMNYIEFEGQELTITKQVNLSYKGGPCDDLSSLDQKPPNMPPQPMGGLHPPPPNQNSAILNCLNSNINNTNSPVIGGQQQMQQQQQQQDDDLNKIKNEFVDNFGGGPPPLHNNDMSSPLSKSRSIIQIRIFSIKKYLIISYPIFK